MVERKRPISDFLLQKNIKIYKLIYRTKPSID